MKKILALLLSLLLLSLACTALAVEVQPGKTVTVTISVAGNPDGASSTRVKVDANTSVFEFDKAGLGAGISGSAPNKIGGNFVCKSADTVTPLSGTLGTITLRVKEDAAPGTYNITVSTNSTYDADFNKVSISVSGNTTVVVPAPAHVHTWDDGKVTTEPTCTKDGETTFTCSSCDEIKTEPIKATGEHLFDDGVVTTPATCTKDGVLTRTCTYGCGQTKTEVIKATEHKPGTPVTVAATCEKDGSVTTTCTVCNEVIASDPIKALGHKYGEFVVTTEPTCCTEGVKTATCANDAAHTKTEKIAATGEHVWDAGTVTTEPTCEKEGVKTFKCTTTGCTKTKTEKIDALGHKYEEGADYKAPTCTEEGYSNGVCTVCGKKQNGEKIPALGHKYESAVTTAPTCEKDGVETFTCKNDASHTYTKSIKKLGHDYDEGVVTTAPTCDEAGVKTFTCKNDASHTKTQAIKALGHKWSKWVVTKEPTEDVDGEQQRTCETCGKVEIKAVSAKTTFIMTTCTEGIRFRDLENPVTDYWYMFTPIDLSVDGEQTFDMIAGNIHKIGTVTVVVKEGTVTVTYKLVNRAEIELFEEFMTILPSLEGITELDFEALTNYAYGEAISIEEQLGGDTKVLLLTRNLVRYVEGFPGMEMFNNDGEAYLTYVEELKQLMD